MANDSKKQSAKSRFAKAKQDAEDAELASPNATASAAPDHDAKTDDIMDAASDVSAKDTDTLTGEVASDDTVVGTDDATLEATTDTHAEMAASDTDTGPQDDVVSDTISGGEGTDTLEGGLAGDTGVDGALTGDPIADNPTPNDGPADDLVVPADPSPEPDREDAQTSDADDGHAEPHDDHPSFAATALKYLIIFLVGIGVALWAAPRLAPHLPAPIAAWVAPGGATSAETEARLASLVATQTDAANQAAADAQARADAAAADVAALSARLDENIATLRDDLLADIGAAAQTRGAAADRIETVAERLTAAEAALAGLRTEVESLAGFASEGADPGAATLERVAAFGAAVEGLRSEVGALSARASEIEAAAQAADVEALEARVSALEGGEAATASARTEAEEIVRRANIDAAMTRISQSLAAGRAYGEPLDELARLTGVAAPAPLSTSAATGAPTLAHLTRTFPGAAQAAYAAALKADAGEGILNNVFASVQGRVGGRPSVETPGDDVGAVLSRMEARLSEGALKAVQGEAQSLSAAAQGAMAPWLGQLDQTVAAQGGLDDLRATLTTQ